MRRLLTALLIVAAAAFGVACGEDDSLSADEAAAEFERLVSEVSGNEDLDVECEDASEEDYWDCTGEIAGFPGNFQLHVEGDTIDLVPPKDRVPPAD